MMVKLSTKKRKEMKDRPFLQITSFSSISNDFPLSTNEHREETASCAVSAFFINIINLFFIKPTTNPQNYNDIKYMMKNQVYWTYICSCDEVCGLLFFCFFFFFFLGAEKSLSLIGSCQLFSMEKSKVCSKSR